jgi:hypothetical protein
MKTIVVMLCAAALLPSCATRYQPIGTDMTGGHSFHRHSEDVFSVKFIANSHTAPKRASDFAMLRAAELCHEHHFSYFTILGAEDGATHYTPNGMPAREPIAQISIRCFTRPPGGQAGKVYTAASVAAELRAKYGIESGRCA